MDATWIRRRLLVPPWFELGAMEFSDSVFWLNVEYLERKGLYRQDSIGLLRGMRIGVEGFNWLKTLQVREPFQLAMGGIPLTLVAILANELEGFRFVAYSTFSHAHLQP
jgi:hypothetical protein